jgi:hypothetical protein
MLKTSRYKKYQGETVILVGWALVNFFFLYKNGIIVTGEAGKYISQAQIFLQTGRPESANFWLYIVQISLLAFCLKFHLSFAFVFFIQLFFNLLATLYFYKTVRLLWNNNMTALTATFILLFNVPYQEYNTLLQTESLFFSFTLILSCYVIVIEKISLKNLIIIIVALTVISITRPTGILFFPPVFLYLFFIYFKKLSFEKKAGIIGIFTILFLFILNKAMMSGGELDFMLPFKDERIICGVPTLPGFIKINTASNGNSLYGLLYYVIHNFGQFAKMAWLRTVAFFGLYRSYFGASHNIYLVFYFYILDIGALLGSFYWYKKHFYKLLYFHLIITLVWVTTMMTCDDWHNRFYLSISPYIIFLFTGFICKFLKNDP